MSDLELFSLENPEETFESQSHENGFTYWYASDLMQLLGYESWQSFQKAINKAMATCTSTNIPVIENFVQCPRIINDKEIPDFKLSRLGCYLTAMNGDNKKPEVAKAQAYFATQFRGVPANNSLLDFMGRDELAANLFRITQTELKIKNENIHGQKRLEDAANSVGKKVRKTILDISGVPPEQLLSDN